MALQLKFIVEDLNYLLLVNDSFIKVLIACDRCISTVFYTP